MRRKEKEIANIKDIEDIIMKAKAFHLGLCLDNTPYVIPMSFGYKNKVIYFHSATEGKKIEILKQNNQVCFEFNIDNELVKSEKGCNFGMKFRSVIGFGKACFIEALKEKQKALDIIMHQYSEKTFEFPEKQVNSTLVCKIEIEQMTGKQSGY